MYSFPYPLFSYFNLISIEHCGFCVHGEFGSRLTTDNFQQIILIIKISVSTMNVSRKFKCRKIYEMYLIWEKMQDIQRKYSLRKFYLCSIHAFKNMNLHKYLNY